MQRKYYLIKKGFWFTYLIYLLHQCFFKDNAKTASYGMVIVVGVAITGYIAYTILSVSILPLVITGYITYTILSVSILPLLDLYKTQQV